MDVEAKLRNIKKDLNYVKQWILDSNDNYNTLIDNPFVLTSGMCTIGKHKLFVDVHGNFYPCEKVGETNKDFLIGLFNAMYDELPMPKAKK